MLKFRKLTPDDIEIKVGAVNSKGYTLLLYKNARVDMAILDEAVGAENWQNKFYEVCGNLYCSLGINVNFNTDKEPLWIWKDDCGVESAYGDKEKGQASDARKRAGFAWGIGRELYSSPFVLIPCETTKEGNSYKIVNGEDKLKSNNMRVKEITYNDNGTIKDLVIVDNKGVVAFSTLKGQKRVVDEPKPEQTQKVHHCRQCGVEIEEVVAKYSLNKYGTTLCRNCQKQQGGM